MTLITAPTLEANSIPADEATLLATSAGSIEPTGTQECCLVQIYPADVVDGMLLMEAEELVAGRDLENDLYLPDSSVSRNHAKLERTTTGYRLRDLGSTNGTHVNGNVVASHDLQSGDTIQLGCYLFKFLSAGSVESQYHETVYSTMTRDALTGTLNKRYLMEALQREIARSRRQQSPLAVIMLDIDHFKIVNDTHGHLVGDEVLREFGKRVGGVCRTDDLLARYGGEEFCLVMFGSDRDEALAMAERCRRAVCDQPFSTAAGELPLSASFGFAILHRDCTDGTNELLKRADDCLYQAKRGGRNQVCG